MKKLMIAAILGTGFLISCTPKAPAVTGTQTIKTENLAEGKILFDTTCKRCHDLPNPKDHSAQDWVGIMNSMAPKAKLNETQHQLVYDYIVSVK